eukprot:1507451-Alexandrium_andersonii.AAC.1
MVHDCVRGLLEHPRHAAHHEQEAQEAHAGHLRDGGTAGPLNALQAPVAQRNMIGRVGWFIGKWWIRRRASHSADPSHQCPKRPIG